MSHTLFISARLIQKIRNLASLFWRAFGGYKWQIATLAVIGFVSGILEGVGVNALIPLFSFVAGGGGGDDFISRLIERLFRASGVDFSIAYLLVFIASLFLLKAVVLFIGSYIQFKISYDYEKHTRAGLFKKILRSAWPYLLQQKIGHLEKVLSSEIQMVARLLRTLSSLVLILTGLLIYILVAINISSSITLITLGVGLVVLTLSQPLVRKIRELSRAFSSEIRSAAHFINENIIGMKTVKSMTAIDVVGGRGEDRFETLRSLELQRSLLGMTFGILFQPLSVIFVLLLFLFSYKTASFHLPSFVAVVYLIQRIFSYVQNLQTHLQAVSGSLPYLEHVLAYETEASAQEEDSGGPAPFIFQKEFSFEDVSFGYGPTDREILSRVSFSVTKGAFVGLIGPSGAGKTTVVDLILRLFVPSSGDITLDGIQIKKIDLGGYRKNVGYVSQDLHLINDTIENNIRFFDDSISEEVVVEAARKANVYDVIQSLPDQFGSVVGERGVHLSVGQRQRIVIARVLARKPQFLILDEATSALDNESEKKIQEVIEGLKGSVTVLVIAHRLGTVMRCDNLLVLGRGRIIESGRPQDLLRDKQSYFFKMYNIRE